MGAAKAVPTQVERKDLSFVKHLMRYLDISHVFRVLIHLIMEPWAGGRERRNMGLTWPLRALRPFLCPQMFIFLGNLLFSEPPKAHGGSHHCPSARSLERHPARYAPPLPLGPPINVSVFDVYHGPPLT